MRILITGSRNWTHREMIADAILKAVFDYYPGWDGADDPDKRVTVVHGAATGADTIAGEIARYHGFTVESHPAEWEQYGKRAGFIRNDYMVKLGADVCLAFPLGESKGTRMCMKLAAKANIPVVVNTEDEWWKADA